MGGIGNKKLVLKTADTKPTTTRAPIIKEKQLQQFRKF